MSNEKKTENQQLIEEAEADAKNNKRCLGCPEILTDENAKEHYRTRHPVLYTLAYDGAAFLAEVANPTSMAAAASFALCGKCRRDTPPCQYCAPMFDRLNELRLPSPAMSSMTDVD